MNEELTIKEITAKTHKYRIKVYKIRIELHRMTAIWYASKKGQEFYAVLACKIIQDGNSAVFRLVDLNEERTFLKPKAIILDVYPGDCVILDEFIVRSHSNLKKLYA